MANVTRRLVSADQRSALVVAELLDTDPQTGKPLDYVKVGDALEKIRHKYETPGVSVQIIGFAKVVDDMTDAAFQVGGLFVVALLMMGLLLWIDRKSVVWGRRVSGRVDTGGSRNVKK